MIKRLLIVIISMLLFTNNSASLWGLRNNGSGEMTIANSIAMANKLAKGNDISISLPDESYMNDCIAGSEFIYMIFDAVQDYGFKEINTVLDGQILDVDPHRYYAEAVYSFARYGIIECRDGLFHPDDYMTVEEAKEIEKKIKNEDLRVAQEYVANALGGDSIIAEDSFYVSPAGYTRFTNVYVSTPYNEGYVHVDCSDRSIVSADIYGWFDDNNAGLYIAGKRAGVAEVTLVSMDALGNVLAEDKLVISIEGQYKDAPKAELNLSDTYVNVGVQKNSVVEITLDMDEEEYNSPGLTFYVDDPEIASANWCTDSDDYANMLEIQGLMIGQTTIFVECVDKESGVYLTGKEIKVSVLDEKYIEKPEGLRVGRL